MYRFTGIKFLDTLDFASIGKEDTWETGIAILVIANYDLIYQEQLQTVDHRELVHSVSNYSELFYEWYKCKIINVYGEDGKLLRECDDSIIANYDDAKPLMSLRSAFIKQNELKVTISNHTKLNINQLEMLLSGHKHNFDIVAKSRSESGSDAASNKWEKKNAMKERIVSFIESLLDKDCRCDHAQMKEIVWIHYKNHPEVKLLTNAVREEHKRLGQKPDPAEYISKKTVLEICKEVYELTAPDRIYKVTLHKRMKGCPVHS